MTDGPTPLANIEAEQALLGALLVNNQTIDRTPDGFGPDHFYDPVHARIWEKAAKLVAMGRAATPVSMKHYVEHDAGLKELGGPAYLARMAGAAVGVSNARDYAETIMDLARRRKLLEALESAQAAVADPNEDARLVAERAEADIAEAMGSGGGPGAPRTLSGVAAVTEAVEAVSRAYSGEQPAAVHTGMPSLDKALGGLFCGDMIVLAGRPGMGKSAIGIAIARRIANRQHPVLYVTREMTPSDIMGRVISEEMAERGRDIAYSKIREGDLEEDEMRTFVETAHDMGSSLGWLAIYDATDRRLEAVLSGIRRQLRRWRPLGLPPVVIIDYLQKIRGGKNNFESASEVSGALKDLAKAESIPVVALAQVNRQIESREDKRPQMSDLRDSGEIEQDADVIGFCFREEHYHLRSKPKAGDSAAISEWYRTMDMCRDRFELAIAKRRAGALSTVAMKLRLPFNQFIDDGEQPDLEGFA